MSGAVAVVGFASIGGILFGLDQGNWGGAIVKDGFIDRFCIPHCEGTHEECIKICGDGKLLPDEYNTFLQWGSALLQLGAAVGALIIAPVIAGRLGRRETMCAGSILTCCGVLPCMFVTNYAAFLSCRFFAGVGVGQVTYALPMFISEVAPAQIRGVLGSMMQLTVVCGVLFASCLNLIKNFPFYMAFSLPAYPAAIVAFGIFFFPMSPRFALLKFKRLQQPEEGERRAKESLKRLRGNEIEADKELVELKQSLEAESKEAPFSTLFTDPSVRRRVIIANLLQWGQQFTGVNAILSYGPAIFADAGVPIEPLQASVMVNFCMLLATIASMYVIDVWGRRLLLLVGGAVMFISLGVAAILAKMINDLKLDPSDDACPAESADTCTTYGYILVVAVCIYAMGFGPWGIVPWVYPSEIFPMDVKEKAMSTSVTSQWGANFLIAFLVVGQVHAWGAWGTLAFYSVCCGLVVAYVALCVPEIKGVKMDDMESVFGARTTGQQEPLTDV
jgi:sugar porter (SP) family MFS transporter